MGKIALFDLREEELSILIFEKKGHSLLSRHTVPFSQSGDYSFGIGENLGDIDESYLSLPLSLLNFRIMELPFSDMNKVLELLPFELDGLILGGAGDIIFDACLLKTENSRSTVLVPFVRKGVLRKILSSIRSAGFDPKRVCSLELGSAVSSEDGFSSSICNPEPLEADDRLRAAIQEIQNPTVDFRKGDFAYTADTEKMRKSLRLTAVFAALLFFLFLANITLTIAATARANRALQDNIRKTYQALFPTETKISNELYQLKAHVKELQEKEASFVGVSPLQVLQSLARISRPGITVSELAVGKESIILKGECPSLGDTQKIKSDLEEILSNVSITDTRPSSNGKTFFSIAAKGGKP